MSNEKLVTQDVYRVVDFFTTPNTSSGEHLVIATIKRECDKNEYKIRLDPQFIEPLVEAHKKNNIHLNPCKAPKIIIKIAMENQDSYK